jgi:hypothetical protein
MLAALATQPPRGDGYAIWLDAAAKVSEAGEHERAKLLLSAVVQANPADAPSHVRLVQACLQLGQTEEALKVAR